MTTDTHSPDCSWHVMPTPGEEPCDGSCQAPTNLYLGYGTVDACSYCGGVHSDLSACVNMLTDLADNWRTDSRMVETDYQALRSLCRDIIEGKGPNLRDLAEWLDENP